MIISELLKSALKKCNQIYNWVYAATITPDEFLELLNYDAKSTSKQQHTLAIKYKNNNLNKPKYFKFYLTANLLKIKRGLNENT